MDKIIFFDEMYNEACAFKKCAEYNNKSIDSKESIFNFMNEQIPTIVNYAFACELFLKLINLYCNGKNIRIHKLEELFDKLPNNIKVEIETSMLQRNHRWNGIWGFPVLNQFSNAFVEWRYKYENDMSKGSTKRIDLYFLKDFCEVLQEYCISNIPCCKLINK